MPGFGDAPQVILQWARALQGRTRGPTSLDGDGFSEGAYLQAHAGQSLFEMFCRVAKLALQCTFGEYAAAVATALDAERSIRDYTGTIWDELRVFYHAVALAAPDLAPDGRAQAERLATLAELERRLAWWAENAPANFRAQHRLVAAELARVEGRDLEAAALYEEAISAGAEQACPRETALANELCARFWQRRGQPRTAAAFLAAAREAYARWGAAAKVAELDGAAPTTAAAADAVVAPAANPAPRVGSSGGEIDLATVMKAAQVLSSELELPKLLGDLMRIAIENAGAERGSLTLEGPDGPRVRASGTADLPATALRDALTVDESPDLSPGIVHYVRRTRQSLVIADARREDPYASDPYVIARQPRSVLCTAMVAQGRLVGTLYLENSLVAGAFTPDRLRVLQLLAAHAATAIEKAELFAEVTALRDRLEAENVYLREEIGTRHEFEELVGESPALRRVLAQIEQVAPTDTTVLIAGETGTGKELVARAIHRLSGRHDGPLVTVNCGAIAPGLVESELFGHEKGAFTGALSRKIGRFELADGGTVFLDEIGDLQLDLQVKLLRVLQEGEITRVGASRSIRVSVRVIAATHRDLHAEVRAGRFRQDLYYRLNVFPIRTPTLRERKEDIPALVRHLVLKYSAKMGKRVETIPRPTLDALTAYSWPGNIRELGNIIERSVIISRGGALELGEWIAGGQREAPAGDARTLEEVEREYIVRVLIQTGWRVSGPSGAARILGLKPTTLEARMRKLGIMRPTQGSPIIS
jgi:transcriptional regulator with GAF, ATPase, and Fis domain